ncbi:hypothetical protein EsHS_00006568 [Epichloe bromicola]
MSTGEILYKLHHVFLPPKLPEQDDAEPAHDKALLNTVISCFSSFKGYVADVHHPAVDSAMTAIRVANDILQERDHDLIVDKTKLKSAFSRLVTEGGSILIYISSQNAGLMVSRLDQEILFESFELSPRNKDVISTRGRLRRSFPGSGVSIALSLFELSDFQEAVASMVSTMSWQAVPGTQPEVKKAQQMHEERRDTTDPMMVTEFLMTVLVAHGGKPSDTTTIGKSTREEVLHKSALLPWRRSPLWLSIRVTLQIMMSRLSHDSSFNSTTPTDVYKQFMLFIMANVARECHDCPIESDYLSAVSAKLNRRLLKLRSTSEELRGFVNYSLSSTNQILEQRWSGIQNQNSVSLPLSALKTLDFAADSEVEIPLLDNFVNGIAARQRISSQNMFAPLHPLAQFHEEQLPKLPVTYTEEQEAGNLMALETWVARSLRTWLESQGSENSTSERLRFLMEDYFRRAIKIYGENPELVSVMTLTILELWVACDISTSASCPMLKDYDPGLSCWPLQNLLLPYRSQLERLDRVEDYISQRLQRSVFTSKSMFGEFGSASSFAVRYFQQSRRHKELLGSIEEQARVRKSEKLQEFDLQKQQFRSLMDQQRSLTCEYTTTIDEFWGTTKTYHSSSCQKCRLKNKAESLSIDIYEWPLPSDGLQAASTVFELLVPESFGHWRDSTAFVVLEVLKMNYATRRKPQYSYTLRHYCGLSSFMTLFNTAQRVELLSETKPHQVTHRKRRPISTSCEADVCLKNGLQYQYFDNTDGSFTEDFLRTNRLPKLCTYQVSNCGLQRSLFRPADEPSGPPPNSVLANLHDCPDNMSLEEYKALCTIPLGYLTQWQNILLQLSAPIVDFKKIETELVLLQCIGQVGPRRKGAVLRSNHSILDIARFAEKLIDGLFRVSNNLRQNWQAASAFGLFTSLATHVLSVSSHGHVRQRCEDFLGLARVITLDWTLTLKDKVQNSTDNATRDSFQAKAAAVALHFNWLVKDLDLADNDRCAQVQFDLQSGELLVDGIPLNRLPTNNYSDVQSDLLVRASKDGKTFELLSADVFRAHFPVPLVEDHIQWLNITDNYVDFRPQDKPWKPTKSTWQLCALAAGNKWRLGSNSHFIIPTTSKTGKALAKIFRSVEVPAWIQAALSQASGDLEIALPRLLLGFRLGQAKSDIFSKEFQGMAADESQSVGTFIGLRNKLVLKNNTSGERSILVPDGKVSFRKLNGHTQATIDPETVTRTQAYNLDNLIGRVVDNGSARGKLFSAYLHALTSFCLPDPLTGRTGTEQALSILDSAAVKSFDQWSTENFHILSELGSLTPGRKYYPANERVMQTVKWSSQLGFLAQHGGFIKLVQSIFDRTIRSKFFYQESWVEPPRFTHVDLGLLDRDDMRSATFRPSNFGAELHSSQYDRTYNSRDRWQESPRVRDVFSIANTVYRESMEPHFTLPTDLKSHLWRQLSSVEAVMGQNHADPETQLTYDAQWMTATSVVSSGQNHADPETQLTNDAQWTTATSFVSKHWVVLHRNLSRGLSGVGKFDLALWLSTMAYGEKVDRSMLFLLAGFSIVPKLRDARLPSADAFHLEKGVEPKAHEISQALLSACHSMESCPENSLPRWRGEAEGVYLQRKSRSFDENRIVATHSLAEALRRQWPCERFQFPADINQSGKWYVYIKRFPAIRLVNGLCKSWFENRCFQEYLGQISDAMPRRERRLSIATLSLKDGNRNEGTRGCGFISMNDVFSRRAPHITDATCSIADRLLTVCGSVVRPGLRLPCLVTELERKASSTFERKYVKQLEVSLEALDNHRHRTIPHRIIQGDVALMLEQHQGNCTKRVNEIYRAILGAAYCTSMEDGDSVRPEHIAVPNIYQWPRICPAFLLQQLCAKRWRTLSPDWKSCIVKYGIALTHLQQAERLLSLTANQPKMIQELENIGHTNWRPIQDPESLLIEIESGVMIREVQAQIAAEMRRPSTDRNGVMQLNMGEGKSSVIAPIVAASLADESLVRVIVAKPQAKQMFDMLVNKLGGLVNRPIFHAPFSRAVKPRAAEANAPEHVLSFKLMGIERACSGEEETSRLLLQSQELLNKSSRDIVDESDENFSPKFELVYTMGTQRAVDHSPSRWTCLQEILDIFRDCIPLVETRHPDSVETWRGAKGSFPRTRFLRSDAMDTMATTITRRILDNGLIGFPMVGKSRASKKAISVYITQKHPNESEVDEVEGQAGWTEAERSTLFLLRGLIAGSVLAFCFSQKRWRVDYGLALDRIPATRLAVPYRAKDNPSPRSEFSHPDVVILLTLLSYYYRGLNDDELFLAFAHLQTSDQASAAYQEWVKDANKLPSTFHQLDGVNLDDHMQCRNVIFPSLRWAKSVIDYYLAYLVFPKEMKEFPHKLSASGWDIAEVKKHVTTGFSGTNDSRIVLPLSIEQLDLDEQRHTNALVLEHLLQPENQAVPMLTPRKGGEGDAERLISMVVGMENKVRVIIDVGAQILEFDNRQVAEKWLERLPDDDKTQAVVFFDDDDNICALDRNGKVEFLHASRFAARLDVCLIFLDEAHTRGTDLKLPQDYRAAVTLGANLTKDRLVQACMRMRQLGKGQSVVFCVPEEILHKIRIFSSKSTNSQISVSDVLGWSISETWTDAKRCIGLWSVQGKRHQWQQQFWTSYRADVAKTLSRDEADRFLEPEAETLGEKYGPEPRRDGLCSNTRCASEENDEIDGRSREFETGVSQTSLQQEAERELCPEAEEEKQVEKPEPAEALPHKLHDDVVKFVESGEVQLKSKAYMSAFESLSRTSAALPKDSDALELKSLFVTADFASTVALRGKSSLMDSYQRPVQWILTRQAHDSVNASVDFIMIISPFEAQGLMGNILSSKRVSLHIYAPRPNLGYQPLDSLDLFTMPERERLHVPQSLTTWLNLFSGQLYFKSWSEYTKACDILGVAWRDADADEGGVLPGNAKADDDAGVGFRDSLTVLMKRIRRNCEEIERTHVGTILGKRKLMPGQFPEG